MHLTRCWLCHGVVKAAEGKSDAPASPFELRAAGQSLRAVAVVSLCCLAVVLGVFLLAPGLAILLAVVVIIGLAGVWFDAVRAKARGRPMTRRSVATTVAASFAITMGLIMIGFIALTVAILAICAANFSRM